MDELSLSLKGEPKVTACDGEKILEWKDKLTVVVLRDGSIGQFASQDGWSRNTVETAVNPHLRAV